MVSRQRHGSADHELYNGTSTDRFKLIRDDNNSAMYSVENFVPEYRNPFRIIQQNWIGGHGQYRISPQASQNGATTAYFEGQSIDTTHDGVVFLGPAIATVQENDDTALDSAVAGFYWYKTGSKWVCWTAGKVYFYATDDTSVDTNEAVDASETGIDVTPDATTAIPVNSIILIDSELMQVNATGTTLTVTRGYGGTTAATHNINTSIYLYKWDAATTTLAGVTAMAEYNGVLYAGMGASTKYYYSTDADTWTQTDLTDGYANGFCVAPNADGTQNVLWKFKTANEVSSTTDGRTVAAGGVQWTSPTYVGDTSHNITNIFYHNDKLRVGKADNLFELDSSGGVHALRNDLKQNPSTNNYKYICEWQTSMYHSEERGGGEIGISDTYAPVWPLQDVENIGKVGDTIGIASDKNWLYWAVDEGTNNIIYKGRETVVGNKLVWQWCPWIFLSTNACSAIAVCQHSTTDRRLWFGYGTSTGYVILSDDPLTDSAARFTTSGWLRGSYDYGTNPIFDKMVQSCVVDVAGLASGETLQIKYRKDTDTSATECVATATFGTTNGTVEKNFSSALACKRIQFEIWLASDTCTATPQVRYFEVKGVEKPTTVRYHSCVYAIGDEPTNRADTLRSFFRTCRTSTTLLKFADLRYNGTTGGTAGTDYVYAVLEPDYPQEVEIVHRKDGSIEMGIRVKFREVSFS